MKLRNHRHTERRYLIALILLSSVFLFLSYVHNIYEATQVKNVSPDRILLWGEHIFTYDYNVYLSKIRQGMEGRWTVVDKYDNHPEDSGVFLQMLYLLSGKLGGLLGFTPGLTFHVLRTFLSFAWILTIIYINKYFLKKPRLYVVGALLSLLAASFPVVYRNGGALFIDHYISWWQELDVLKRISYVPHYTLNYIIISILTVLLHLFSKTKDRKYFMYLWGIFFISFFIHPSAGITFLFSWALYHTIQIVIFKSYDKITIKNTVMLTAILLITVFVPSLYAQRVTSDYPWKSLVDFDYRNRVPFPFKDYFLGLGPVLYSGILGMILVVWQRKNHFLPLVTWFLGALLSALVFKYIPDQFELRSVQNANHVPLAILTVYFIVHTVKKFRRRFVPFICYGFVGVILILGIVQSFYSLKRQTDFIRQRSWATIPLVPYPSQVLYPLKDFWNGILWFSRNTQSSEVVLSKVTAGNYIPAYAGNFVYFGQNPETPQFHKREDDVNTFFEGLMTAMDARQFLKDESIAYVFYGPQEKDNAAQDIEKYDFLTPVYETFHVTIFKVHTL